MLSDTINFFKNLHFLSATASEGVWQLNIDQIGTKFGTNQRYFILNITSYFIRNDFEK